MKWSNASTSSLFLLAAGLTLGPLLSGCASRQSAKTAPPPVPGTVNLDLLVRQNPGWTGVGRYDVALQQLRAASSGVSLTGGAGAALPAWSGTMPTGARTLTPGAISETAVRLSSVQNALLTTQRMRREAATAEALRSARALARREARQKFLVPEREVRLGSDLELQILQANVVTLTRTLDHWKQSTPPTPRLDAVRANIEADRAKLIALIDTRLRERASAQTSRAAQVQGVRDARAAYVQAQVDTLAARLQAEDARFLAERRLSLAQQQSALLTALARPAVASVPIVGSAGAVVLPGAPLHASGEALAAAEDRLKAQRLRWVRFLYEDTRAAAQDAAERRNWTVTFGPARAGARDLTQPMAQALESSIWHRV